MVTDLDKYAETGSDDADGCERHEVGGAADEPLEVGVGGGGLAELQPQPRPEQPHRDRVQRQDEVD